MRGRVHLPIFFLAFVIAVVVKFAVHEDEQLANRVIEAQVTYNMPATDVVAYDLVDTVRVGLRGKQSEIVQQTVFNVEVIVDVPED